jgi:hypothetical protein
MDKKLLDAFNNLSKALDLLANTLDKNKKSKESGSATGDALKNQEIKDIATQIKDLSADVKSIKSELKNSNQKILKNQETLLNIAKKPQKGVDSKTGAVEDAGDPNKNKRIKDGALMILGIAVAVLAIGMAFKMIGKIDIASVVTLALAIPLIAYAFEKVYKLNLNLKEIAKTSLILIIMSGALMLSSWFMKGIATISIGQGLTAIFIAATFVVISYGIKHIVNGFKGINPIQLIALPLILVTLSLAITGASWIMQGIMPISFSQGLTAIFIAATFAVVSFSAKQMVSGFKGINPIQFITLPIILISLSYAITKASEIMQGIVPIGFAQGLTAIFIAATFAVISFGIGMLVKGLKDVSVGEIIVLPLVLITLSAAIVGSSYILEKTKPIKFDVLLSVVEIALTLAIASTLVGLSIFVLKKLGLGPLDIFEGGISIVIIAGTIYASSLLLSKGNYTNPPGFMWALQSGLSILVFGLAVVGMALAITKLGLGPVALIEGAVAVLGIAAVILGSSKILAEGDYGKYPTFEWAEGVGMSLLVFGLATLALGAAIEFSGGLAAGALLLGAPAVLGIAALIVGSAAILSTGNYGKYPTLDWAEGVGLSLLAFGLGALTIGGAILATIGLGKLALSMGQDAILSIAETIVAASQIFAGGTWNAGPSFEWALGVSMAIGAFYPLIDKLSTGGLFSLFTGGLKSDDIINTITGVAVGLVVARDIFKEGTWTGGPTAEWAQAVSTALSAFMPLINQLDKGGVFSIFTGGLTPDDIVNSITGVALGLVIARDVLKGGDWTGGPTPEWADAISKALGAFAPVFGYLHDNSGWFSGGTDEISNGITAVAHGIKDATDIFSEMKVTNLPDGDFMDNIATSIKKYIDLSEYLATKGMGISSLGMISVVFGMSSMASAYYQLAESVSKLTSSMKDLDLDKLNALKSLSGNIVLMSLIDSAQFGQMMDTLEDKSNIISGLFDNIFGKGEGKESATVSSGGSKGKSNDDLYNILSSMNGSLAQIATNTGASNNNLSQILNEARDTNKKLRSSSTLKK